MGLLQKACETYDCHASLVGLPQAEKETLAPVSHILTSAQIEITVDQDGQFQNARAVDKSEPKIVIPVTEESGGRSGTNPKPPPLRPAEVPGGIRRQEIRRVCGAANAVDTVALWAPQTPAYFALCEGRYHPPGSGEMRCDPLGRKRQAQGRGRHGALAGGWLG